MFRKKDKPASNVGKEPATANVTAAVMRKPMFPAFAPSNFEFKKDADESSLNPMSLCETNQIYVTNLPPKTNMAEINSMFPECVGISLGVNNASEPHAAYVEFNDAESAESACNKTRGASLRGNTLIISPKLKN